MLPENAEVLLVQADGVLENDGFAASVRHDRVEIADLAEAIAAELETIGERSHAVLALVERILPPVRRRGIAVRDDHLRERRAVQDRPDATAVLVADGVKDETLTGSEADPQSPLLPRELVARELEARTVGLRDVELAEIGARARGNVRNVPWIGERRGSVVAVVGRQRNGAVVLHLDHFHPIQVDERDEAFDRAGVAVVVLFGADPGQRPHEPAGRVVGLTVVTGRPRVDHRQREVGHAALLHGGLPLRIPLHHPLALEELVERDRRLDAGDLLPREDRVTRNRDDDFAGRAGAPVADQHECLAVERIAAPEREHRALRGLVQEHADEERVAAEPFRCVHDGDRGTDLVRGERVERMKRGRGLGGRDGHG